MGSQHRKASVLLNRRLWTAGAFLIAFSFTANLYCASACEINAAPITAAAHCPMHPDAPAPVDHEDRCPGCSDSKVAPEKVSQIQPIEIALPFAELQLPEFQNEYPVIVRHSLDPAKSPPLRLFLRLRVLRV